MTTTSKVILGLIGAAAVGAAVGLLMAPDKGSNIRRNIADAAGKWTDKMGEKFRTGKDGLKRTASQVTSQM